MQTVRPNQPGVCQLNTPSQRLTGGEIQESVKKHTVCGLVSSYQKEINPNLSGRNYTFYPPSLDLPNVRPNHIGPNEAGSLELPPNRLPRRILPPASDF